jgi:hypothetical protein
VAGVLRVGPEKSWSVAGWLFDFVVRTFAATSDDADLRARLREIATANLGYLDLSDCTPEQRSEITSWICDSLLDVAERELPTEMPGVSRPATMQSLRELVAMSCSG